MSLKKLIVASDFSKYSEYALLRAQSLAEHHTIPLHLIHVLKRTWAQSIERFSTSEQQNNSIALIKSIEDKLVSLTNKHPSGISFNLSVLRGRAAEEIIQYSKENQGSLIIAGAHGQYYIHEHVLGTTSSDLIAQSNTPVLLIKKEPSFSYKKILIATDFSQTSKKAIEFVFQCFPNAQFQLLHVLDIFKSQYLQIDKVSVPESKLNDDERKDCLEHLDDFLKSCNVNHSQFDKKIMGGYLADTIVFHSKRWQANLLVFGAQGHSKLHYFLLGSVAKRLLQLSETDMLAVP